MLVEMPRENSISIIQPGVLGENLPCGKEKAACLVDRIQALQSLRAGFKSEF